VTLRADPAHLSRLAGGGPMLLVAEGVMDPSPLACPALEVWLASSRGGAILLHPAGTRAPEPAVSVALETPPMGTIALVATERLRVLPITRWWTEVSGLPAPPFLLAATGQAALAGLVPILAGELSAAHARDAATGRALVAARQELEETREAMAGASRVMAHRPPVAPRLVLSGEVGNGPPVTGAARHVLGTGLAGLAALAVHVAGPGQGGGRLRFRLRGGETDRVAGAWVVPAAALATGWLTLDLPTPIGPLRETAVLEILPEGSGLPGLSRDARWAGASGDHPLALRAWVGEPGDRYLAPAFWAPGDVGLAPPRMVPLALPSATWALARPLAGQVDLVALGEESPRPLLRARPGEQAVLLLPGLHGPELDRVRIAFAEPTGSGAAVSAWLYPADRAPSDLAALEQRGGAAAETGWRGLPEDGGELTLPLAPLPDGRGCLVIGLRAGPEEAAVEVTSLRLSADQPDIATALPGGRVTTPRPVQPTVLPVRREPVPPVPGGTIRVAAAGSATREAVRPVLPTPVPKPAVSPPASAAPDLGVPPATADQTVRWVGAAQESAAPAPAAPRDPTLAAPRYAPPELAVPPPPGAPAAKASEPVQPPPAGVAAKRPAAPPVPLVPRQPRAPARYEAVRLHQHLPGESYRHLELTVASLAAGPARWAALRLKLASKDGEPRLEFRQAPGWPHMFRDWLGRASDKFGPFLRITRPELQEFLASITDERDAAMMRALISVLPRLAEDACRQAGLSVAETAEWIATAKLLLDEADRPVAAEAAGPAA
jgi:hypothetical protein